MAAGYNILLEISNKPEVADYVIKIFSRLMIRYADFYKAN